MSVRSSFTTERPLVCADWIPLPRHQSPVIHTLRLSLWRYFDPIGSGVEAYLHLCAKDDSTGKFSPRSARNASRTAIDTHSGGLSKFSTDHSKEHSATNHDPCDEFFLPGFVCSWRTLVMISDGLPEAPNKKGDLLDYEAVKSCVEKNSLKSAEEIKLILT